MVTRLRAAVLGVLVVLLGLAMSSCGSDTSTTSAVQASAVEAPPPLAADVSPSIFAGAPSCTEPYAQRSDKPLRKIGDYVYAPQTPAGWFLLNTEPWTTNDGPNAEGTLRGVLYAQSREDLTATAPQRLRIRVSPLTSASARSPETFIASLADLESSNICRSSGDFVMLKLTTDHATYVVVHNKARTKAALLVLDDPAADDAAGMSVWNSIRSQTSLN